MQDWSHLRRALIIEMMITSTLLGLCGLIAGINAQLMDDFEDMNDLEAKQSVFGSYGPPPLSMVNLMRQQLPMSLTSFTAQKQSPARRVAFAPSSIIASSTKSAAAVAIPASTSNAGQSGFLNRHNYYRAMHQAPPLFWDNGLASSADAFSSRCTATHSGTAGVGENIYWNSRVDQADVAALDSWYSEKLKYDFGSPGFSPNAVVRSEKSISLP